MSQSRTPANCGSPPTRNWRSTAASDSRSGLAASSFTNRSAFVWLLCTWLLSAGAAAQELTLEERIDAATAALEELDNRAAACRSGLESAAADTARQRCETFLEGIDGEVLANYLDHCRVLKDWREAFIQENESTTAPGNDPEQNLQLMVGVESACGENALQRRTEHVVATFTLLQDGRVENQRADAALLRRLAELQFDATLNGERRALQNRMLLQQSRRLLETQRQWDDLEDDLIRQEIRNPSAAFPRN